MIIDASPWLTWALYMMLESSLFCKFIYHPLERDSCLNTFLTFATMSFFTFFFSREGIMNDLPTIVNSCIGSFFQNKENIIKFLGRNLTSLVNTAKMLKMHSCY